MWDAWDILYDVVSYDIPLRIRSETATFAKFHIYIQVFMYQNSIIVSEWKITDEVIEYNFLLIVWSMISRKIVW